MEEMIGGSFVFVTGVVFLYFGLFQNKWLYKGIKEIEEGKIDFFPFISSYWFWRILFIGMGAFLIFTTGNSFISYVFL
ncbi:hypothetical protein SRABI96_03867 [Peribacillus sp. Bi96]|uniref:hypothetical protein n=1 Tax=unclassified Peribacillus TaxID=2675266 RepID=UPI001DB5A3DD|nr:hypothetical protein [Peribacillus sp. Bi96]CAH0277158.1 hypothetical protein SRABI96_03867 [Peribacillus sp. Bi96]